jgi:hypothetical protein
MKIDKDLVVKVVVVLICLGFMLEAFAFGAPKEEQEQEENAVYLGTADLNVTLSSYRPYLYVDRMLEEGERPDVLALDGVDEIIDEESRSVISISDSRKVPGIYSSLRRMNITTYTLAGISMPSYFEMYMNNGSTVSVMGTSFEYMTEPVSEMGGKMLMRIVLETRGEMPYRLMGITPLMESMEFALDAEIEEGEGECSFTYIIPWEEREIGLEGIEAEFGEENVHYEKSSSVVLAEALGPQEMIDKKHDYVQTISERAITVKGDFTDRQRVMQDFGEDVEFVESILVIRAEEEPELNFSMETAYMYRIRIPEEVEGYNFYTNSYEVAASGERNATIPVLVSVRVLGETVMEINSVEEQG